MATDFGSDFSCLGGLNPQFPVVTGNTLLGQALANRLQVPRGGLFYDKNYGTDIRGYLNSPMTPAILGQMSNDAQAECLKDERVLQVAATPVFDSGSSTVNLTITGISANGPFTFILSVSDVSVTLLSSS